jgi:hypothetical protein
MNTKAIAEALRLLADAIEEEAAPAKSKRTTKRKQESKAEPKPETKPEPEVTLDAVKLACQKLAKDHGRDSVYECLKKFNAKGVLHLEPADYADFITVAETYEG